MTASPFNHYHTGSRTMPRESVKLMRFLSAILLCLLATLTACDRPPQQSRTTPDYEIKQPRIVSLAPSITKMIVDLGRSDMLVGVAQNDDAAPANLPVVGNSFEVNTEALAGVHPTLVLTMESAQSGVPERLKSLSVSEGFTLVTYPYPNTINESFGILFDAPAALPGEDTNRPPSLGKLLGVEDKALLIYLNELKHLSGLTRLTEQRRRPYVLMVISTNPVMASGQNTVLNELLSAVGGLNCIEDPKSSAPTLDKEMLTAPGSAKPDVVLLLMPKAAPLGEIDSDDRLAFFRGLDIPAVKDKRIVLINDPLVLLPSSNLVEIGAAMAKAIHPDLAEQVDAVMKSDPSAETPQSTPAPKPGDGAQP